MSDLVDRIIKDDIEERARQIYEEKKAQHLASQWPLGWIEKFIEEWEETTALIRGKNHENKSY